MQILPMQSLTSMLMLLNVYKQNVNNKVTYFKHGL